MTITALGSRITPTAATRVGASALARSASPCAASRFASVDDADRDLPCGETGEVVVRGDTVMAGYWHDAAASAETLRGGWLHTGDLGSFDEHGFLTLKDRSKDMIIRGGSNIYPREVEEALLRHAAIAEVSVVGRPHAIGARRSSPSSCRAPARRSRSRSSTASASPASPASSARALCLLDVTAARTITARC